MRLARVAVAERWLAWGAAASAAPVGAPPTGLCGLTRFRFSFLLYALPPKGLALPLVGEGWEWKRLITSQIKNSNS